MIRKLSELGRRMIPDKYKRILVPIYFNLVNLINYRTTDMFHSVEVETMSVCNRKCSYCPVSKYPRPYGLMPTETYKKIVNQLSDIGFKLILAPHFYNEPLMDKRLPELISYTRKKLPEVRIKIFTNGDFLTEELYTKLIDNGVDEFFITDHDNSFKKNKEIKGKRTIYRLQKENLSNRGGLIKVNSPKKKNCKLRTLVIDYKGNVVLCCNDYFSKHSFGNVNERNIMDIWEDIGFKLIRKNLSKGVFDLDICKRCSNNKW